MHACLSDKIQFCFLISGSEVHCLKFDLIPEFALNPCNGPSMFGVPTWNVDTISNVIGGHFPASLDAYTEVSGSPYGFKGNTVYHSGGSFSLSSTDPENIWLGIPSGYTAISQTQNPDEYVVFVHDEYYSHNISGPHTTYRGYVIGG